jgi:SAM-dependent methyltransferase
MKTIISTVVIATIILSNSIANSQNINKLPYKPLDKEFIELTKRMSQQQSNDEKSIELALEGLETLNKASYRYNLIFWKLSFLYAGLEQYDSCFEILKKGQDEGLFYYLGTDEREFPPYLKELKKFGDYESFRVKNEELKEAANNNKTTEFIVQLPNNYYQNESYPLLLIMHGGIGSIPDLQYNYLSEKLSAEFIVVYTHGGIFYGSNSRAYDRENWQGDIKNIYQQITSDYAIDTTNVILAGPSAGSYRSLVLGLNNEIPATGLLLSFAVNPQNWDSTLFINSAKRGLKVALLCGENDWAIQQQKKLGYWFDKYGIKNRFVVFPEEGHGFPENWTYYLNTSLDFILEEE